MTPVFSFEKFLPSIRAQAAVLFPKECCGFVIQGQHTAHILPVDNIHEDPKENFRMPDDAIQKAERQGEIIAVYHSHPNAPAALTQTDLQCYAELGELPWIVVSVPGEEFVIHKPDDWTWPLLGRPFVHGVCDCYSLARDYYKRELGILLPDYERKPLWWEDPKADELYLNNYANAGFVQCPGELKKGDGILMQLMSTKINHAAVYLGSGLILHHVYNRLSCIAHYEGYWRRVTYRTLRHKTLC